MQPRGPQCRPVSGDVEIRCVIKHFDALCISANTSLLYQAPVTRFDAAFHQDEAPYVTPPPTMGFFAPRDNCGATLQLATSQST